MEAVRRVLPYLRSHAGLAAVGAILVVATALVSLLLPWPMKFLVDHVLGDLPLPEALRFEAIVDDRFVLLIWVVVAGLVLVLLQNVLTVLREYLTTRLNLKITLDFRGELFQHAQRLSLAYHDRNYSGKLVYVLTNHADAAAGLVMTVPALAQSALTFVGMFWIVIGMDLELALASLIVVPLLYRAVGSYARRIQDRLHRVKDLEGQTLSMIQEAMAMLRVIVAFGREDHEGRRFRDQGERALSARVDLTVRQTLFGLNVNMITAAGIALVIGLGGAHVLAGKLTVGQLLVVLAYISTVYQSLGSISSTLGSLQDQRVSLKRAFALLDTEPDIRDVPGAIEPAAVHGRVRFEEVSFGYRGEREVLSEISFEAAPGDYVGIVGPTGAGKTTLVSLIPRFYDPDRGRILIDGQEIRPLKVAALRRQISIVGQDPILFAASIADNIRYGRLDASADEVERAARAANAHEFIERLEHGYQTVIGERGAGLSGGERQRIAVARAFLKDAPILILDEPTAAIDARTEARLLDALERLRQQRTTFMVSHRLASVRGADLILVLDRGRIVQRGTHDELVDAPGIYRQLLQAQAVA